MKAVVITKPGGPDVLQIRDVEDPRPTPDEISVKVHTTALNRADLLQRLGHYPPPAGTSADIPGLEFAGKVVAIGNRVSLFRQGDRVMGLLPGEGYAEYVVTHERMAMPIPDQLNFDQAAAIPEVFLTAYDVLFAQLKVQLGERLLIHAVGSGVGLAALQMTKVAGAEVFGTAGSSEKIRRAAELGLDHGIVYTEQNFDEVIEEITDGKGVHAVLDLVGSNYWEQNLKCLAPQGRMVLVGLLGGSRVQADLATIMRKRLQIIGTVLRARPLEEKIALTKDFEENVLPLFQRSELKPVVDRVFPLEEAAEAHAYMESNRNFGKIVLRVS